MGVWAGTDTREGWAKWVGAGTGEGVGGVMDKGRGG